MAPTVEATSSAGGPAGIGAARSASVAWSSTSGRGRWLESVMAALRLGVRVERPELLPQGGPGPVQQHPGVVGGDPELAGGLRVGQPRQADEAEHLRLGRVDLG